MIFFENQSDWYHIASYTQRASGFSNMAWQVASFHAIWQLRKSILQIIAQLAHSRNQTSLNNDKCTFQTGSISPVRCHFLCTKLTTCLLSLETNHLGNRPQVLQRNCCVSPHDFPTILQTPSHFGFVMEEWGVNSSEFLNGHFQG